jgi:hypothetical protein
MSRPLCLLLEADVVYGLPRDGAATADRVARRTTWNPDEPGPLVEALRWSITEGGVLQAVGRPRGVRRGESVPPHARR